MKHHIENIIKAIGYIEEHLAENLDLDTVAGAVHYSKYYLHRMFVNEVGLTIHDYVQRRQLTEAANYLVFSDKPIMEIAITAGYESQQAFTAAFKEMYKKPPSRYREDEEYYPLQLPYILNKNPIRHQEIGFWMRRIMYAVPEDIPAWMELVRLVVDGFPCLDEEQYAGQLQEAIDRKEALIVKDGDMAVGVMIFCEETGNIEFLGVHPQYRCQGIAKAFLRNVLEGSAGACTRVSITTFREGDKADTGYRHTWKSLGFAEEELLMEFGYPTQRFILQRGGLERGN